MSFSIFNSNKRKVFVAIVTFVILIVMFDLLLHLYVQKRTTLNTWVEEKSSKSIHLKKNNFSNLDYIFIGSSRTIFHISTNYFKNRGMDIYNFGVSGAELVDFPYMVARSLKEKPQNIIISLSVNSLYQGSNIGSYESLTYEDLGFIYKSQPMRIKAEATKAYLKTIHKILVYSNPIYLRISQLYGVGNINAAENQKKSVDKKKNKEKKVDCEIFNYNYPSKGKVVGSCTNGDGVLFGNNIDESNKENKSLDKFNEEYIQLLKLIIEEIQSKDVGLIIILEPIYKNPYRYNLEAIKKEVDFKKIVDFTTLEFGKEDWADSGHLNNEGRLKYSKHLADYLLKEIK